MKCKGQSANAKYQNYHLQQLRGQKRKLDLISLFGGGCSQCGYRKNSAALHFHHKVPTGKLAQLDLRKLSNSKWEWCLEEAKKCELLCSNCHAETHNPARALVGPPGIEPG